MANGLRMEVKTEASRGESAEPESGEAGKSPGLTSCALFTSCHLGLVTALKMHQTSLERDARNSLCLWGKELRIRDERENYLSLLIFYLSCLDFFFFLTRYMDNLHNFFFI